MLYGHAFQKDILGRLDTNGIGGDYIEIIIEDVPGMVDFLALMDADKRPKYMAARGLLDDGQLVADAEVGVRGHQLKGQHFRHKVPIVLPYLTSMGTG